MVTNGSFDSESPLGEGPVDDVNVEGHISPLATGLSTGLPYHSHGGQTELKYSLDFISTERYTKKTGDEQKIAINVKNGILA